MRALLIVLFGVPLCAAAQRADDNAVKSADDAFGNIAAADSVRNQATYSG